MKHLARACLAVAPLVWSCYSYDFESMTLDSPDAIVVGDTVSLGVFADDGSRPAAWSVAWSSSDNTVATVDELGLVTGVRPGWVVLGARIRDYSLDIPLQVLATAGPFVQIYTGADHSCALAEDGSAWCWGSNELGQLGTAAAPDRCHLNPLDFLRCAMGAIPVDTDLGFTELARGHYHNCGLSVAGTAHCWGSNDRGQLGDGATETRPTPLPVVGAHVFKSLAAGGRTSCGITVDDALWCWGSVIGASAEVRATPTQVAPEHRFALAVTSDSHTCGVTRVGATYCWGTNNSGQLGVASVDTTCGSVPCTRKPQEVTSAPPFVDLALGREFSCGLTAGGVAYCWGDNEHGQLGDGTRTERWQAMPVAGGHTFTDLEADQSRACGLDGAGFLYCWGSDPTGFGNGGNAIEVDRPVPGAAQLTFTAISIGFDNQCGVARLGITWCWGSNLEGAVGNGETQRFGYVTTPKRVIRHPAH